MPLAPGPFCQTLVPTGYFLAFGGGFSGGLDTRHQPTPGSGGDQVTETWFRAVGLDGWNRLRFPEPGLVRRKAPGSNQVLEVPTPGFGRCRPARSRFWRRIKAKGQKAVRTKPKKDPCSDRLRPPLFLGHRAPLFQLQVLAPLFGRQGPPCCGGGGLAGREEEAPAGAGAGAPTGRLRRERGRLVGRLAIANGALGAMRRECIEQVR